MKNLAIEKREEFPAEYEIVEINANDTTTLRSFFETMAKVFEFPDYFGFNLDSFDEMMNDLSWIENDKFIIHFTHSESFLANERNETKILTLLDLLDATIEEWKWFETDEEELITKKDILIRFSPSERMQNLLEKLEN